MNKDLAASVKAGAGSADARCFGLNGKGLAGGRHEARGLILFDINKTVEHTTVEFHIFWADPFAAPALKGRLADIPSRGKGSLV